MYQDMQADKNTQHTYTQCQFPNKTGYRCTDSHADQ